MVNTSVKNVSSTSSIGNLVLSLSLLIGFCLFLQGTYLSQNYFITVAKDSMACKQVNFFDTNAQGKIIDLEYVTEQNDTVRLSKKDIPEIYKICQDGVIYLRMPLQLSDPDGYYRYGKRVVKGKITVDIYDDVQTMYRLKENFDGSYNAQGVMKQTTEGTYLRHVTLPNGSVYEISGLKALKGLKVIQKFMFECDEYEKEYFSNPKYQTCTFEEAVSDYNVMCP